MENSTLPFSRSRCGVFYKIAALVVVLFSVPILAGGEESVNKGEPAKNPHGDRALCSSCHATAVAGRVGLRFGGNISQLCQSCHDGRLAIREAHPVDMKPSASMAKQTPYDIPLENGKLTCLSCHDVSRDCKTERPADAANRNLLRGARVSHPMEFCFRCHLRESYRAFNAHDQLEAGKPKTDTCIWCHDKVPDVNSRPKEGATYLLRSESFGVCDNCHKVEKNHPTGDSHMFATPTKNMMWHMSAYEIQPRMNLPFERLLEYVRAANRTPRSVPLDENGRITCYSCHNPHEKGLLPTWNLRSVGAEPKKAVNHRLRSHEGAACRVCHEK
jgi:hypothetical protein